MRSREPDDPMPSVMVGDEVRLSGFGWRVVLDVKTAAVLKNNDGVLEIKRVIWARKGKRA